MASEGSVAVACAKRFSVATRRPSEPDFTRSATRAQKSAGSAAGSTPASTSTWTVSRSAAAGGAVSAPSASLCVRAPSGAGVAYQACHRIPCGTKSQSISSHAVNERCESPSSSTRTGSEKGGISGVGSSFGSASGARRSVPGFGAGVVGVSATVTTGLSTSKTFSAQRATPSETRNRRTIQTICFMRVTVSEGRPSCRPRRPPPPPPGGPPGSPPPSVGRVRSVGWGAPTRGGLHFDDGLRPVPADLRGGDQGPRLGPARRRLRLRRRVRRPPVVRGRDPRPRARVAGLSRRDPRAARLEERRRVARHGTPPALLRRQRREHGLDDQPLHGEPEASQRRRLLAGRSHRAPARPAHADLRAALPRGVPRRAGGDRRRRGVAAAHRALRLLERRVRPSILVSSKADLLVYGMGERRSSRSRGGSRRASPSRACATCAASPTCSGARRRSPTTASTTRRATAGRSSCPRSRRSRPTRSPSRRRRRSTTTRRTR